MTDKALRCLAFTLRAEGGYVHDPPDPETYRGLSRAANPDWPGWAKIDARKPIRRGTIFPDLEALVYPVYAERYWVRYRLEERSEPLALACLDFYVHSGAGPRIVREFEAAKGRLATPVEICRLRGHYMVDLACGVVLSDQAKVRYWTGVLPGWMRRLRELLRAVRAMEG
jgi:hypothetical protein